MQEAAADNNTDADPPELHPRTKGIDSYLKRLTELATSEALAVVRSMTRTDDHGLAKGVVNHLLRWHLKQLSKAELEQLSDRSHKSVTTLFKSWRRELLQLVYQHHHGISDELTRRIHVAITESRAGCYNQEAVAPSCNKRVLQSTPRQDDAQLAGGDAQLAKKEPASSEHHKKDNAPLTKKTPRQPSPSTGGAPEEPLLPRSLQQLPTHFAFARLPMGQLL